MIKHQADLLTISQVTEFSSFDDQEQGLISFPSQTTWKSSFREFIFGNPLNWLLIILPFALILPHLSIYKDQFTKQLIIFILNFISIIPLSKLLGSATEEIAIHTNAVIGGLLNATFGNAVELIIAIIALDKGLIRVVQSSLLGSVFSNLLLVLGFCFLFGGVKYSVQTFNVASAQAASSMLVLSILGITVPAAFDHLVMTGNVADDPKSLTLSRGTAVILLILYILYLIFQLKTHSHFYVSEQEEDDEANSKMLLWTAVLGLLVSTLLVSISAEYLVGAIETVSKGTGWSETFIGLIIVPIVGNAAEHVSAVSVALKNKMDLALNIAIGSSTQVILLLAPVVCIAGWIMDKPMSLDFQPFETLVLFVTVLIVNYLVQDGKSHWLEGATLLAAYLIIALAFFLYPAPVASNP